MNTDLLIKGFFSAIFSLTFSWTVWHENKTGSEHTGNDRQQYLPIVHGNILPMFLLFLAILLFLFWGAVPSAQMLLSICFTIFPHISLYYLVLLLVLPFFRKYISAHACAMLWLIPNYLYITIQNVMKVSEPLLVFRVSGCWLWILFTVWLVGFLSVLVWKIGSHLRFRKLILKSSHPVTEKAVLDLWQQEITNSRVKNPYFQLVISPDIASPLTVGLFRRTMKVILPERSYSARELELIFRHEIIHISREDCWSKFFLMFCTAMCWFNPMAWSAMRKSAEDMELSCDEAVLRQADKETRLQYASLLLSAAEDERGFTTCLSAASASMRYRLRSIIKPHTRSSGTIVIGLTFFFLFMSCGYVALSYGNSTGKDILFHGAEQNQLTISDISSNNNSFYTDYVCIDEQALYEYLAALEMDCLTGNYSFSQFDRQLACICDTPEGKLGITLSDYTAECVPFYGDRQAAIYYLPAGVDWGYLDTIILTYSPAVHLEEPGDFSGRDIPASLEKLTVIQNGKEELIHQAAPFKDEVNGIFGYVPCEATFSFPHELAEPFTLEIDNWNHTSSYTITPDASDSTFTVSLPAYPAHYRVYADFKGENNKIYRAQFRFDVGPIEME